ncbi:MAG: TIGR02444 family protein [Alphaproteobacteria bacterium]|nr:TIGR02444 family protein [Alphaproteobacteria bacterium]
MGLWAYAVGLYSQPGVARACLTLQDRHGADVNLLLAACFFGASGRGAITAVDLRRVLPRTRRWQGQVVAPLRAARRALKERAWRQVAAALRLRQVVQRAELTAERIELRWLELALGVGRRSGSQTPLQDAAASLRQCCGVGGEPPRGAGRQLEVILAAAFPGVAPRRIGATLRGER